MDTAIRVYLFRPRTPFQRAAALLIDSPWYHVMVGNGRHVYNVGVGDNEIREDRLARSVMVPGDVCYHIRTETEPLPMYSIDSWGEGKFGPYRWIFSRIRGDIPWDCVQVARIYLGLHMIDIGGPRTPGELEERINELQADGGRQDRVRDRGLGGKVGDQVAGEPVPDPCP